MKNLIIAINAINQIWLDDESKDILAIVAVIFTACEVVRNSINPQAWETCSKIEWVLFIVMLTTMIGRLIYTGIFFDELLTEEDLEEIEEAWR